MPGRGRPPYPDVLTPAEQRVLHELRKGGTNVEIAVRLGLSPDTVKSHIASMLGKLDLDGRHALAAWRPDRERRRLLAPLALPAALASLGRPLLWAGGALGAVVVVAVVVVLLVTLLGQDDEEYVVRVPTAAGLCSSGMAVPNPAANPELVADCETLLELRDRLAGKATLNWSSARPMTTWTGVTIAGTPQRVANLELANSGLTGELTGLMGNLTGLTHLRLNGNALTGRIPSKLQLLTALTHAYLAGNTLTGCVPPSLRTVAKNDIASLGLADCAAPIDISSGPNTLTAGTYQFVWEEGDPPLIFDVPAGLTLSVQAYALGIRSVGSSQGPLGLLLGVEGSESLIGLDVYRSTEWSRYIAEEATGASGEAGASPEALESLFDLVVESAWIGNDD